LPESISLPTQFEVVAEHDFLRRFGAPALERQQVVLVRQATLPPFGKRSACAAGRLRTEFSKHPALFHRDLVLHSVRIEESMEEAFLDPRATLVVQHEGLSEVLSQGRPSSTKLAGLRPAGSWTLEFVPPPDTPSSCEDLLLDDILRELSVEITVECSGEGGSE
jgi:hypothetical protein